MRESLPNFLMTQWHETLTEDQIDRLVQVVLDHLDLRKLPTVEGQDEDRSEETLDSKIFKRLQECLFVFMKFHISTEIDFFAGPTIHRHLKSGDSCGVTESSAEIRMHACLFKNRTF